MHVLCSQHRGAPEAKTDVVPAFLEATFQAILKKANKKNFRKWKDYAENKRVPGEASKGHSGQWGWTCKGPEAGMSMVVSRYRENAGGLEGIEPGVKCRVGRWEMQTGANPRGSGVGFILSTQSRGRGPQGLLPWPHPAPVLRPPGQLTITMDLWKSEMGRMTVVRGLSRMPPILRLSPRLWRGVHGLRRAPRRGRACADVIGLCSISTESLHFVAYTWPSHFPRRLSPTCPTLPIARSSFKDVTRFGDCSETCFAFPLWGCQPWKTQQEEVIASALKELAGAIVEATG